jgi:esterase/lipase superfamily enzyme
MKTTQDGGGGRWLTVLVVVVVIAVIVVLVIVAIPRFAGRFVPAAARAAELQRRSDSLFGVEIAVTRALQDSAIRPANVAPFQAQLTQARADRATSEAALSAVSFDAFGDDVQRVNGLTPPAEGAAAPKDSLEVPVFYGTTRKVRGGNRTSKYYRDEPDYPSALHYGVAHVSIPAGLRLGNTENKRWCRFLGSAICHQQRMEIVVIDTATVEDWRAQLAASLGENTEHDVFLFVHGFGNSFEDAVTRAAQIAYDIGFKGTVATYDWASKNETSEAGYRADETIAQNSAAPFREFLTELSRQQQIGRVIVIAHSMGTFITANTIVSLYDRWPNLTIGNLVFAAADIDSTFYMTDLAKKLTERAQSVTLYGSDNDKAMRISARLHNNQHRVGAGPPTVVLAAATDYIDAAPIDLSFVGHSYVAQNRNVLQDLYLMIQDRLQPDHRFLDAVPHGDGRYYRFKP